MEWPSFVKALLWGLLVFLQFHQHRGCFHEERIALLELKAAFLKSNIIHADVLPSWMDDAKSDCCRWERVTCNSTNSHVINLSLDNLNLDPYYYEDNYYENRWLLNVSMLVPLKELKSLDLSANSIGGCLPNEGFEKMSSLRNLRILDLGYNYFDNTSIPQSLGAVTSLETLILTNNKLQGYFPAQELIALRNLNKLDISWNYYNGSLPLQGFERLALLPKLEILNLGRNFFDCSIIPSLSGLASLNTLSLGGNYLGRCNTTTGFESLSRLENLETLDLSANYLNRSIIESLPAIKSLKNLNLRLNFIGGPFPIKGISAFENLEKLDLSYNRLNSSLTIQGSESLSRLENLETLDLSDNYFDKSIIESLSAVKSLKSLNLASNYMEGSFPAKELSAFENLEKLDLSRNNFDGPLTIQGLSNSSISPYIGALSSLKAISLAYNSLNGTLPKDLCSLKKLQELDLYDNLFEGILPTCLNNLTSLRLLDISRNRFVGNISSYLIASPTSLEYIDLSYNQFEGLFQFNIFANHSKLKVIRLASENNKLEIETEISAGWDFSFQLKILVLSNCNLNKLTGNIPKLLLDQRELEIIDLSCNKLTGRIPQELGELSSILALNLSYNQLTGSIPQTFSNLAQLESLDLSHNNLSGKIPSELINLYYLEVFTVAYNNLSGQLPDMKAQFGTFEKSCYEGNPFLCGEPLDNNCTREDESNASEGQWYEVDPQVFFASFIGSYIIFFLGVACLLYIHPYWQQRCVNLIEDLKYRCYYPVFDTLKRLSNCLES